MSRNDDTPISRNDVDNEVIRIRNGCVCIFVAKLAAAFKLSSKYHRIVLFIRESPIFVTQMRSRIADANRESTSAPEYSTAKIIPVLRTALTRKALPSRKSKKFQTVVEAKRGAKGNGGCGGGGAPRKCFTTNFLSPGI